MKPLVSIITPSYNQGRFIRETIESVLSQDYDNVEYIIIDGGSTDNTLEIIKEYEDRITYISEKDNGQSDAINKGFRMAHGEIVAWLNSDDVYEPKCISRAVEEFQQNPKLGLLYGEGYIIDEKSEKIRIFEHTQEFDLWKLVNFWDYIMQPTTFFRADYLKQVGYLDEHLHYCMDWDLWIKLANVGAVKYIPDILACSREYCETKTSMGGNERLKEICSLLQKYSHKKITLGTISYITSTFYMKHANSSLVYRKLAGAILTCVHKCLYKYIPERYEDGWIKKRHSILVPAYVQKIIINVTTLSQSKKIQSVKVFVNDKKIMRTNMYQNEKRVLEVLVNPGRDMKELTIRSKKEKRISKNDKRRVALLVDKIQYE